MTNFTKRVLMVWAGIGVAALAVVFLSIVAAHATTGPGGVGSSTGMMGKNSFGRMMVPGVFGKVTAVNGTMLTITGGRPSGTITYTIDATNAVVIKNATTSSSGNIAIGDVILVQGTVVGDLVTATRIIDGVGLGRFKVRGFPGGRQGDATSTDVEAKESATSSDVGELEGHGMRPSGTLSFASGTFPGDGHGFRRSGTSTASGTLDQEGGQPHMGFFGSMGNFFGHMFGGFKF